MVERLFTTSFIFNSFALRKKREKKSETSRKTVSQKCLLLPLQREEKNDGERKRKMRMRERVIVIQIGKYQVLIHSMYTRRRRRRRNDTRIQNNIIILFSKGSSSVFEQFFCWIQAKIPDIGGNNFSLPSPAPCCFKGFFTPKAMV